MERSGFRSCDWLVPKWLQDHPRRAPGWVFGPSWGGLGSVLGALRLYWGSLGARFGALGPSMDGLGQSFWIRGGLDRIRDRFADPIRRFHSMMRFVDLIR